MAVGDTKCQWCGGPAHGVNFNKTFCSTKCRVEYEQNTGKSTGWGSQCFVATAVYGNENHPVINDLRAFRDNWLDKRSHGRTFISWYYTKGPYLASWIDRSRFLKFIAYAFIIKPLHLIIRLFKLEK
jgi:hypothetical protein